MKIAVVVPTYQAGKIWDSWWEAMISQTLYPDIIVVIDSGSTDNTVNCAKLQKNTMLVSIAKADFNHGGTRNLAVSKIEQADIIIFLTQDAVLNEITSIESIIAPFQDVAVAAVCGRQLPHVDATPLAVHARQFNYNENSVIKDKTDITKFGIKSVFMSNSFAAYRHDVYKELGRFPEHTILAEDMYLAAKMLLRGYKIAYHAEATVRHSHNYTACEEFQRYFDTGVFHACNPWIRKEFGGAGGEGVRFVKSELTYLLANHPLWIPKAIIATFAKFIGFKIGLYWNLIPLSLCKRLGMYKSYWNRMSG